MGEELELPQGLVRIRVALETAPGEPGPDHDWVWGEPLGSDRYRVESCAFFAYGISRDDVVRAGARADDGAPLLEHVEAKCGHRTLRVALDPAVELDAPAARGLLDRLLDLGCTHEVMRPKIVAVDLPPEADVLKVVALFEAGARDRWLVWEWADPRPC
ncbi:MAG TPA: DUF4265 domain-containing protein [Anaeromyxobacteraceae bacterium]|nr:DUF4265 domain-containing protein [Anaeromyxobacteraceae bacterium]